MIPAAFDYQRPACSTTRSRRSPRPAARPSPRRRPEPAAAAEAAPGAAERLVDIGRLDELKGVRPAAGRRLRDRRADDVRRASWTTTRARGRPATRSRTSATSRSATAARSAARSPMPTRPPTCRRSCLALDYSVVLRSIRGERIVPLDGFFDGRVPDRHRTPTRSSSRSVAARCPRGTAGRLPEARAAGVGLLDRRRRRGRRRRAGGSISHAGSRSPASARHAYRAKAVEAALVGTDGSAAAIAAAAEHATDGVDVNGDIHADRGYRTAMAVVYTRARSRPRSAAPPEAAPGAPRARSSGSRRAAARPRAWSGPSWRAT